MHLVGADPGDEARASADPGVEADHAAAVPPARGDPAAAAVEPDDLVTAAVLAGQRTSPQRRPCPRRHTGAGGAEPQTGADAAVEARADTAVDAHLELAGALAPAGAAPTAEARAP